MHCAKMTNKQQTMLALEETKMIRSGASSNFAARISSQRKAIGRVKGGISARKNAKVCAKANYNLSVPRKKGI